MRDSVLCARLGAVCAARRCVLGAVCAARAIFLLLFFLFCLRCVCVCAFARVDGMRALLDTVCAPHCVCGSRFAQYCLHHYSETRMYFSAVQIAAYCCWLVAVTAQTLNAADADALNQTLTGAGCWQSSTCKTKNFNCDAGAVRCNANGSVTRL